jgi:hypothetical protein
MTAYLLAASAYEQQRRGSGQVSLIDVSHHAEHSPHQLLLFQRETSFEGVRFDSQAALARSEAAQFRNFGADRLSTVGWQLIEPAKEPSEFVLPVRGKLLKDLVLMPQPPKILGTHLVELTELSLHSLAPFRRKSLQKAFTLCRRHPAKALERRYRTSTRIRIFLSLFLSLHRR